MKFTMSKLAQRLMNKAETSGNYQALTVDFGDGRAMELTHPWPVHTNPGGMQRAVLINPVDLSNGIIKYVAYDRRLSELRAFGIDDKHEVQINTPEDLDRFVDDVWNHLISAQTQLKWDV